MASNSQSNPRTDNSSFLTKVWEEISNQNSDLLTVVLPSNRACGSLKQIAKENVASTFLLPEITTLEAFSNQLIPGKKAPPLQLLEILYRAYRDILGEEGHSFEQFLPLGEQILADFNEIDLHCIDTQNFFQSLRNIKELESFQFETLESNQVAYDIFWQQLGKIYTQFHELLNQRALYYTGKKFRWLAENPVPYQGAVVFAGFSVLSPAEQGFIKPLLNHGKLILEHDSSFENVAQHESVLERPPIWNAKRDTLFQTRFIDTVQRISAHRCNDNQHQLAAVVDQVKKLDLNDQNHCCIIVPDAALAPLIVAALANENIEVNTTTGITLAATPWFGYLQQVQKALRTADNNRFVTEIIQLLAQDPKLGISPDALHQLLALKQQYGYLIPASILAQHIPDRHPLHIVINILNTPWREVKTEVLKWLTQHTQGHGVINASLLAEFAEAADTVNQYWSGFETNQVPNYIWLDEVLKILRKASIPVRGNAHQGVQVMGMLEVRSLDFKHVLVCNVNEGTLPATVSMESLIPTDLRIYAKLPTATKKEALYGFYFYRLFYRAQQVHLFYLEDKDSEPSRYIHQLDLELPLLNSKVALHRVANRMDFKLSEQPKNQGIALTNSLQERVISYLTEEGLSPSALCDLVDCPKKFLLQTVLRSPEIEDYDNLPNHLLGSVLHNTLENVYEKRCIDGENVLTAQENTSMLSEALALYPDILAQAFSSESLPFNYILKQQIAGHLKSWFAFEKALINKHKEVSLVAIEKHLKTTINITVAGKTIPVVFKGMVDRVHRLDGQLEIIDYKAGKVDAKDLKGKFYSFFNNANLRYGLQLLSYQYLWEANQHNFVPARIFSFVKHKDFGLTVRITDLDGNFKMAFEEQLSELLSSFLECSHIQHAPNAQYCELCE